VGLLRVCFALDVGELDATRFTCLALIEFKIMASFKIVLFATGGML
jgi:hypothetical protein